MCHPPDPQPRRKMPPSGPDAVDKEPARLGSHRAQLGDRQAAQIRRRGNGIEQGIAFEGSVHQPQFILRRRSSGNAGTGCCEFASGAARWDDAILQGFRDTVRMDVVSSNVVYQDQILPHVSRTFALTIPQLPAGLRTAVTCAYLLCRIADTIEDEPALSPPETLAFLQRFSAVLVGEGDAALLAREIEGRLSDRTLAAERDLVSNLECVLGVMARLNEPQRAAIRRCVELMCHGM